MSDRLTLVEGGEAKAQIVIAAEPTETAKEAASALQEYINRISGAELPIRDEKEEVSGTRILVGRSEAVRQLGIEVPSGFSYQINEEGFVIKTVGNDLVIAGNEDWNYRGTIYGVYDFLERLGCRWYFPGGYGEVLPKMETITIERLDIVERPSFRVRNIWYSGWMPASSEERAEFEEWRDRNKMTSLMGLSVPSDGTIIALAPPDKYYESHPEIYALEEDGETRSKEMLCLSEPETVRIAVQTITDTFRNNPKAFTFGFAPADGHPLCYCERCQKGLKGFSGKGYGEPSLSDLWFKFVNEVSREVKKEFPDRWLLTNGYANRVRLPEGVGELSDNIGIQSAIIQACTVHPIGDPRCYQRQDYEQLLSRWTEALRCVFIYDYDPGKHVDNLPFPALHNLKHDIPWFKQRGIWGFWTEGQNSWMVSHLNYYVRAKLMWDAEEDVDALVRDYCERFYGKAADPVERYIWRLEGAVNDSALHIVWGYEVAWKAILTPKVMEQLDADLAEAGSLSDTAESTLHVRVLRMVQEHAKAFLEMTEAGDRGDYAEAVRWVDEMGRIREEAAKVDPALIPDPPEWAENLTAALKWYRSLFQELADRAGGARGELVTMLPREWEFRPDPNEDGQIYQWYLPGKGGRWPEIDTTLYWQAQGYQDERGVGYCGKAWYRTSFFVPSEFENKPLALTFGTILDGGGIWVWVNGFLVDYRKEASSKGPIDVDVTGQIRAGGMNSVALVVNTAPGDTRQYYMGMYRRAFLWSPR